MKTDLWETIGKDSLRVLHAEDSDDCAILLRRALKMAGFTHPPVRAMDGEHAIGHLSAAAPEERPHVILLDLHMPMKNGFDVLEWVRRHPHYQEIPVLMFTSSQESEDILKAEKLGATKFLQKEGTYRQVVQTLENLLSQFAAPKSRSDDAQAA